MQQFSAWSFLKDVLARGAAIHQDYTAGRFTENGSLSPNAAYERYSARTDAAARELADQLKPHLAAHPADDGEPVTEEWLRAVGAEDKAIGRINGEPDYRLWIGPAQWFEFATGGALLIDYGPDKPGGWELKTRGAVRRLCAALGVPLRAKEGET